MKKVSFEDVGAVVATFLAGEGVKGGDVVAMKGNGTVGPCAAGVRVCGMALSVSRDGVAAVQIGGATAVALSGSGVAAGWEKLTGDGAGGVKKASGSDLGGELLVLEADGVGKTAVVLL